MLNCVWCGSGSISISISKEQYSESEGGRRELTNRGVGIQQMTIITPERKLILIARERSHRTPTEGEEARQFIRKDTSECEQDSSNAGDPWYWRLRVR